MKKIIYILPLLLFSKTNAITLDYSLEHKQSTRVRSLKTQLQCTYGECVSLSNEHYDIDITLEPATDDSVLVKSIIAVHESGKKKLISSPVMSTNFGQEGTLTVKSSSASERDDELKVEIKATK